MTDERFDAIMRYVTLITLLGFAYLMRASESATTLPGIIVGAAIVIFNKAGADATTKAVVKEMSTNGKEGQ